MRRREFTIGMLVAAAAQSVRAQEGTKQHRIAVVIPAGSIASISDTGDRLYHAMFQELRRLGDIEGQNLTVERYSGEGRPKGFPDLAREVAAHNPEVIVAITNPVALAVRGVTGTTPIVWIGVEAIGVGLVTASRTRAAISPGSATMTLGSTRSGC
jgi:putative tryptophan/tyrosine transport system substrate-binding protein